MKIRLSRDNLYIAHIIVRISVLVSVFVAVAVMTVFAVPFAGFSLSGAANLYHSELFAACQIDLGESFRDRRVRRDIFTDNQHMTAYDTVHKLRVGYDIYGRRVEHNYVIFFRSSFQQLSHG